MDVHRPVLRNISGRWGLSRDSAPLDAILTAAGVGWLTSSLLQQLHVTLELLQAPCALHVTERTSLGAYCREVLLDGRRRDVKQLLSGSAGTRAFVDRTSGDVCVSTEQRGGSLLTERYSLLHRTLLEQVWTLEPPAAAAGSAAVLSARRLWVKLETADEALVGEEAEADAAYELAQRTSLVAVLPPPPLALLVTSVDPAPTAASPPSTLVPAPTPAPAPVPATIPSVPPTLLPPRVIPTPRPPTLNFSGAWGVDKGQSESLEGVLSLMGLPWLARKVALSLTIVTHIKHDPTRGSVETMERTSVGVLSTNDMLADGVPVSKKGSDGRIAVVTCSVWALSPKDSVPSAPAGVQHPPPVGCMRIVTELPDNMGVTDNVWTLCAGRRHMLQVLTFTKGASSVTARRLLVNTSSDAEIAAVIAIAGAGEMEAVAEADPLAEAPPRLALDAVVHMPNQPSPLRMSPPVPTPPLSVSIQAASPSPPPVHPLLPVSATATPKGSVVRDSKQAPLPLSATATPVAGGAGGDDPFFVTLEGSWGSGATSAAAAATIAALDTRAFASGLKAAGCPESLQQRLLLRGAPQGPLLLVRHSPRSVSVRDAAAAGLGTFGASIPLDGQWWAVLLPSMTTATHGSWAAARWALVRAGQAEGSGDLGPDWLGLEASGVQTPAGDAPESAFVPIFSSVAFEPHSYAAAEVVIELRLGELSWEDLTGGRGEIVTPHAPPTLVPWRGGGTIPPDAGHVLSTLRAAPQGEDATHACLTASVRVIGVAAAGGRGRGGANPRPDVERPVLQRSFATPEAARDAAAAERARLKLVRLALLSRRAAADGARRAAAMAMGSAEA